MKQEIVTELKQLVQSLLQDSNNESVNEKQLLGIQIAEFILSKENIIKKSDVNGSDIIQFNLDECPVQILNAINSLSALVTLDKEPDYSKIEITGNANLINNTLKRKIFCIHALRNSFAHGQHYKIENNCFIIDNQISGLHGSIPISEVITFNNICIKYIPHHDTKNIFNLFKDFNQNQYQAVNPNDLLHIALYSYASIVLSELDFENIDLDFSQMISAYSEINPIFEDNSTHEYKKGKDTLETLIENDFLRNRESQKPQNIPEKIAHLKRYPSLKFYLSIQKQAIKSKTKINNTIKNMQTHGIRSLRNAIDHGHYTINQDNSILLKDMKDQNDDENINYQVIVNPDGLFQLINDIHEKNLTNDDFSFLYYILLTSDKEFFNKINETEKHFQEMIDLDMFGLLQAPEIFGWTTNALTLSQAWEIIINLNNPYHQKYSIKTSLETLKDYLSNMKISLNNLYKEIEFQENNCISLYLESISEPTIPDIDINEMLQSIEQYKIVYQELLEVITMLTMILEQQASLFSIIDNYNFLQTEIPKTKSLDKHI